MRFTIENQYLIKCSWINKTYEAKPFNKMIPDRWQSLRGLKHRMEKMTTVALLTCVSVMLITHRPPKRTKRVIEPSTSAYASPIVVVRKPDHSIRICVDYRKLNWCTVFDLESMPTAESIFAKLKHSRYFSKLDLSKGYWQVAMRDDDKYLTTFITHHGMFR